MKKQFGTLIIKSCFIFFSIYFWLNDRLFYCLFQTPKRPGFVPPKTLGKALGDQGSQMFEVNQASDNDENSEDEEDYYWSGEED